MRIVLENEYGSFEMGGGNHPFARIQEKSGFGLVDKEVKTVSFTGHAGRVTTDVRDVERTITFLIDFYGGPRDVEKLYNIIQHPVNIKCFFGSRRRQITGRILNATEAENIIFHRWQSIVLQFVCDDPYFHDFVGNVVQIATPTNHLPNTNEDGVWSVTLPAVATTINAISEVRNRGNTLIYPVVTLFSNKMENDNVENCGLIVKNFATGKEIKLNYNLSVSEIITIDLPKRKIKSNLTGDITNVISDDTVLSDFYLTIGVNEIGIYSLNGNDRLSGQIEYINNYVSAVM